MTKTLVNDIISILNNQRAFITNIENLSDSDVNWSPGETEFSKRNTIGIVLEHMTGAEKFLIHEIVFGINVNRNRDEEFRTDKLRKVNELVKKYNETARRSGELLAKLEDEDLSEIKPFRNTEKSNMWALLHVIEHNYYHIGQVNYVLALLRNSK